MRHKRLSPALAAEMLPLMMSEAVELEPLAKIAGP